MMANGLRFVRDEPAGASLTDDERWVWEMMKRQQGSVVCRFSLNEKLGCPVHSRRIDDVVAQLRRKLPASVEIQAVRGEGFRLIEGHDSYDLVGGVVMSETGRWLSYGKKWVPLTDLEVRVLVTLHNAPFPMPKADLHAGIWGIRDRPSRVFDNTLSRLRKKLFSIGAPDVVETIYGFGVRLKG